MESAKFVTELPEPATTGKADPLLEKFARELRRKPMNWAPWPREFASANSAGSTRSNLKRGKYRSFRPAENWEAHTRGNKLFVRYVGEHHGE